MSDAVTRASTRGRGAGSVRRAGWLVAAVAVLAFARPAGAQPIDVEAEHQRGITLRNEHRDAEALEVFRGLYGRTGEVRALARMALAEASLSRWVDAEIHLQRALATQDAWVTQNRASLEQGLAAARQHLGSLAVHVDVAGAEVLLAGVSVGNAPLERPLRVGAGLVEVEVRAAGRPVARRTVTVRAGTEVTALDIELPRAETTAPVAPPVAPVPATPPSLPAAPEAPPTTLPPDVLPPPIDTNARRDAQAQRARLESLGTAGLVLGGAGLLTAAIGLGLRESAVSTFNGNGCVLVSEDPPQFASGRDCSAQYERGEASTTAAIVGVSVGAAFTVAGVVLRVLAANVETPHLVACAPMTGGAGVLCGGRF